MTPAAPPTGWVLLHRDGTLASTTIYKGMTTANNAAARLSRGTDLTASPVWTREAWAATLTQPDT